MIRCWASFAKRPQCLVAMEACASAHHSAREIAALGHDTWLIAPAYVKPFGKRQKNDAADAESICEAASLLGKPRSKLTDAAKVV